MRSSRRWRVATLMLLLTALMVGNVFADAVDSSAAESPPGDVEIRAVVFLNDVEAYTGELNPRPEGQYREVGEAIVAVRENAKVFADTERRTLVVQVADEDFKGFRIQHTSDCAINSQFDLKGPAVDATVTEVRRANPLVGLAEKPLARATIVSWARSRHAVPLDIEFTIRPTRRVDITFDQQGLTEFRQQAAVRRAEEVQVVARE